MSGESYSSEGSMDVDRATVAKSVGGFLVAAVILYLFGTVIGWGEITRTLAGANPLWLALGCLSTTVCLTLWAKAWDVVLDVMDVSFPLGTLAVTYFAATFVDYVTPFGKAGGGPFVAYVLSRDERASFHDSLAGVVAADTLNLVPFFLFAAVGLALIGLQGSIPGQANYLVYGLAAMAVVVPAIGVAFWKKRGWVEGLIHRVLEPVAKRTDRVDADNIREKVQEFYAVLDRIAARPYKLAHTLVYSFSGWVFFAAPLYLAGRTLGIPLDPWVVLFVVPASTLAGFVPTPGGLGGVEAAITGLLVALTSVSPATAAAIALVYRVASYWYTIAVGGLAALWVVYRS